MNSSFIKEVGPFRWFYRTAIRQFYKRILKRDHKMRLPTGEMFNLPIRSNSASESFITGGNIDWGTEELLVSLLDRKGMFLDVGAHVGYYSVYVLPFVTHVYSFEPDPRVRALLETNVLGRPNVDIIPCAVSDAPGKVRFTVESDGAISHISDAEGPNQIEVEVLSIDSLVAARNLTVEGIKIDAEGHDIAVIRGAMNLLATQMPVIVVETSPDQTLFDLMHQVNYRIFAFIRHPQTRARSFAEILPGTPPPGDVKMLFLVPERLTTKIVANAARVAH